MYPVKRGIDEGQSWAGSCGAWDDDTIVVSCGDGQVSLVATRTPHAEYFPDERFGSGWEISCRERRNELVATRQFGFVDTRENAVQFLNECRAAINQSIQHGGSIDSAVVSSIVDGLSTDCDVPIMRSPEQTASSRGTID